MFGVASKLRVGGNRWGFKFTAESKMILYNREMRLTIYIVKITNDVHMVASCMTDYNYKRPKIFTKS